MTDAERLRAERNLLLDELENLQRELARFDGARHEALGQADRALASFRRLKTELHDQQRKLASNEVDRVRLEAGALAKRAAHSGVVLTIEQESLQPLAMGHFRTVVKTRLARGSY